MWIHSLITDIVFCSCLCPDMTFINEGNPNYVDKLVNFEKMVRQKIFVVTLLGSIILLTNLGKRLTSNISFPSQYHSAWLPRQWKLYEDAEASLMVSDPVELVIRADSQHFVLAMNDACTIYRVNFYFSSAVPSSPQRGLADRMFLEGPSTRISTCKLQLPYR